MTQSLHTSSNIQQSELL